MQFVDVYWQTPYISTFIFTLHTKLSGTVYCNRFCLFVCLFVGLCVCLWVCYHDNSKLRASIFTKLGVLASWGTGIRGLMRGMATLPKVTRS